MPKRIVQTSNAQRATPYFSQAITGGGLIFVSGFIPVDPVTDTVISGTIQEEAKMALENVRHVIEAAGANLRDVVKTTVYLTDMADFDAFNDVYIQYFPSDPPARTTVAVSGHSRGVRIKVEAIALAPA